MTDASNPFAAGIYNGVQSYTIAVDDRLSLVKGFNLAQCQAALQVDGLQKTVEAAVRARIRRLEKETTMRGCDAIGCTSAVKPGRFLCIRHWSMVPLEVQRTINDRYRTCRKDFGFLSDAVYLGACITALERLAHDEGRALMPTSYHRLLVVAKRKATA
ncbi:hypothetical protein [Variovorax sp.]|uniref:hypothetical protein n=1 Tax=Variovorax sp. TaxID=1871043 RepID=UPI003BAD9EEB